MLGPLRNVRSSPEQASKVWQQQYCHQVCSGSRKLTGEVLAPGNVAVMLPEAAVVCFEETGVVTLPTAPGNEGGCLPETGTAGFMPASALGAAGAGEGALGFSPLFPVLPLAA